MGEQRFKVGDWVRRVEPSDWPEQYGVVDGVYKVLEVSKRGHVVVIAGSTAAMQGAFEPWHPRVGERVRTISGGDIEYIGVEGVIETDDGATDRNLRVKLDKPIEKWGDTKIWRSARHLEPVLTTTAPEQPATLKIEAGRFYKTRDGRKVGPAFIVGSCAVFGDRSNYASAVWADDGRSSHRGDKLSLKDNDIIAEWIDEPVVAKAKASNDNAQPKFKVGDRVKCLKSYPGQFTAGKEYVVSADHFGRKYESVKVKRDDAGSTENGWLPEFFELVAPTTTIVALIENGQPKPSSTPHVHASTGAAEKEAKRLAAKYKGKQFGVFTLTTTHEEAAPVYDHKWQNMAALGLKIDAIKELRAVAGLTLKGAKDAVEAWIEYENAA
ncbi:hypothetical protein AT6N2_C0379 [Agrobacterium tumefaciens]|uniref:hypothetical protein n=1 Tax=Agrobacterium tumefaciens TaxID=358 RepID=UPI001ADAF7CC|nr:hypothetical protein [Agrobacterium tumefaciens]QTK78288.1 hypothetical protein AT6N2_C0379 [Agrobacterium tumefaciens]